MRCSAVVMSPASSALSSSSRSRILRIGVTVVLVLKLPIENLAQRIKTGAVVILV